MNDIVIVDYGMANLRSVQKAFEKVGHAAVISCDPNRVAEADKVVLPGVGAFRDAIARLHEADLAAPILAHLRSGKPFFGVCLGLQLLFTTSYEDGVYRGLDYFPGEVVRFKDVPGLKVPHMGWNQLRLAGRRRRWRAWRRTRPSTSSTPTTPRRAMRTSSPPRPITRRRSRRRCGATTCSPRSSTRRRASASGWKCCGGSRNGSEIEQGRRSKTALVVHLSGLLGRDGDSYNQRKERSVVMSAVPVTEQTITSALRRLPTEQWPQVLAFIDSLQPCLAAPGPGAAGRRWTATELRRLPPAERDAILRGRRRTSRTSTAITPN